MSEDNGKDKKDDVSQKKTKADIIGRIPEKSGSSPVEKIIFDRYGDIGLRTYSLTDGQRTAEEIMKETGLTEAKLVEILDFMDAQGIIKLDYPKGSLPSTKENRSSLPSKAPDAKSMRTGTELKAYESLVNWAGFEKIWQISKIERPELSQILKRLEIDGLIVRRNGTDGPEWITAGRLADIDPVAKKVYAAFGKGALRLYALIDGKADVERLKKEVHNADKIVDGMVKRKLIFIWINHEKKIPVLAKLPEARDPLIHDPSPNQYLFDESKVRKGSGGRVARALGFYKIRLFQKAADLYGAAIEEEERAVYYLNRGAALYGLQRFRESVSDFTRAGELDKTDFRPFYNRGLAYFSIEEYEKAVDDFSKAVKLKPDFADTYHFRGLAFEYSGKLSESISDYEKALVLEPNHSEVNIHLQSAKAKKAQERPNMLTNSYERVFVPQFTTAATRFSDLGGMAKIKDMAANHVLYPLQHPEKAEAYGKRFGGGILFYGPPGCGKSYAVEAIAGEADVKLIRTNIADTLNMYVGNNEKNLKAIFDEARKNQPCVIFFDEIEAMGGRRDDIGQRWERTLVNQFLIEMDNIDRNKDRILVVGATNAPWDIDHALRRSGRFTYIQFVEPPDQKAREEIFRLYTKGIKMIEKLDYGELVRLTDGFSCANIKAICEKARDIAWKEAVEKDNARKVGMRDFLKVITEEKSDVREWFEIVKRQMNNSVFKENYRDLVRYAKKSEERKESMFG